MRGNQQITGYTCILSLNDIAGDSYASITPIFEQSGTAWPVFIRPTMFFKSETGDRLHAQNYPICKVTA